MSMRNACACAWHAAPCHVMTVCWSCPVHISCLARPCCVVPCVASCTHTHPVTSQALFQPATCLLLLPVPSSPRALNSLINMTVRFDETELQVVQRMLIRVQPGTPIAAELAAYHTWLVATPAAQHHHHAHPRHKCSLHSMCGMRRVPSMSVRVCACACCVLVVVWSVCRRRCVIPSIHTKYTYRSHTRTTCS